MATLEELKLALRAKASATTSSPTQPLSDSQYDAGFKILGPGGSGKATYEGFIVPQLSLLVQSLCKSRSSISVLEIGPGPESVLGFLPSSLRQKIKRYTAFEAKDLFAKRLEEWLGSTSETELPLPCLENLPVIKHIAFGLERSTEPDATIDKADKFDLILFCHSMYGMKPKSEFIERALGMMVGSGMVVVFHRETLHLDGLVCHRTASFPTRVVRVVNNDEVLDCFAPFIAGFVMDMDLGVKAGWRKVCRHLGGQEQTCPDQLSFSSPDIMATFTRHATSLSELLAKVPVVDEKFKFKIKNREACFTHPAAIIRPTEIQHIQQCIHWALNHETSLTVVGGSHSGQCLWPNVVAIDMGLFDQIFVQQKDPLDPTAFPLVVVESGCKSGDIISEAMEAGLTIPMGSRPSVGAGLWLQGGIGHLARQHGLTCDAIVGAVVVSVASGEVLCVGNVPSQHQPADSVRPENEDDLLWALGGAGTNTGIVISITLKAYPAPVYAVWDWHVPLGSSLEARLTLSYLNERIATDATRNCSVDAYLYYEADKLYLGVQLFEPYPTKLTNTPTPRLSMLVALRIILGREYEITTVDGKELFEEEMYMTDVHGRHSSGKTSSFKRCIFLKDFRKSAVVHILLAAVDNRPTPACYLHLLHGGGAVNNVVDDASAFGCRDWNFACVITGVWPRNQDGSENARNVIHWVYQVALELLPLSKGAYGADLGPDPRDAALAAKAFGPNLLRLSRLKHTLDPNNMLAYACPIPPVRTGPQVIIIVTGKHGVGKDHCAGVWAADISAYRLSLKARVVSISDATKREYAAATGADLDLLLHDRAYKEQHRVALSAYFQHQLQQRPRLAQDHFLSVVSGAAYVDVLLITGMRDEAPVATLSELVPYSKLIEVFVKASRETRSARRELSGRNDDDEDGDQDSQNCPNLIFNNDMAGNEAAKRFCEERLSLSSTRT